MQASNDNMAGAPPQNLRFGRYEALFRIGIGGMAEVYAARIVGEAGFEKLVAVKRMLPHLSHDDRFLQMFLDEARLAANVQSPHVAQTFDLGRANDDSLYLVMELVVGVNLTHILVYLHEQMQFIDPFLGAEIVAQAAQGLDDAHEARTPAGQELRLVHRDVSPQNIMVGVDGRTRVTDFGIAKAIHLRTTETQAGEKKGKYSYFSPEQAFGKPVDRRSDVFALGVVAWEFLLGRRLFPGTPLEAMDAIRDKPIPVPHELRPELGEEISQVILDALVRDPEKRIQSCLEFSRRIRKALNKLDEPPSPRDTGAFVELSGGEWLHQMRDAIASAARGNGMMAEPAVKIPDATTAWSEIAPEDDAKPEGQQASTSEHEAVTRGVSIEDSEVEERETDPPVVPSVGKSSVTGKRGQPRTAPKKKSLSERETTELPAMGAAHSPSPEPGAIVHQLPESPASEISASDAPTETHVRPEFDPEHRKQDRLSDDTYSGEETAPVVASAAGSNPSLGAGDAKDGVGEQTKAEMARYMPRDATTRRNVLVASMLVLPVLLLGAFAVVASSASGLEVQDAPFPGAVAKQSRVSTKRQQVPELPKQESALLDTHPTEPTEVVPVEPTEIGPEKKEEPSARERRSPRKRRIRVRAKNDKQGPTVSPSTEQETPKTATPKQTTSTETAPKATKQPRKKSDESPQLPSTDRWQ